MRYIAAIILAMAMATAAAQEKRQLAGIAHAALLDTYLTPEHYSGAEIRYIYEYTRRMRRDTMMFSSLTVQLNTSITKPRSKVATDYSGLLELSYGLHHRILTRSRFTLSAGAEAGLFVGGIYNDRNGNNPAQLKTGIELAPAINATYGIRLFRKDLRLRYKARAPIAGLQFSPAYGQSYYEIFTQGNYDHNINFTSLHNAPTLWHMLTVDIPLRRKALTVGYLGDYRQAGLNNLKYHSYTHAMVIGLTL